MHELYTPQYLDFIAPANQSAREELEEIEQLELEISKELEQEQNSSILSTRYSLTNQ